MRPQLWSNHISSSHDFNKRELTPPEDTYIHTYIHTYVRTHKYINKKSITTITACIDVHVY